MSCFSQTCKEQLWTCGCVPGRNAWLMCSIPCLLSGPGLVTLSLLAEPGVTELRVLPGEAGLLWGCGLLCRVELWLDNDGIKVTWILFLVLSQSVCLNSLYLLSPSLIEQHNTSFVCFSEHKQLVQAGKPLPIIPKHRNMCLQCGAF